MLRTTFLRILSTRAPPRGFCHSIRCSFLEIKSEVYVTNCTQARPFLQIRWLGNEFSNLHFCHKIMENCRFNQNQKFASCFLHAPQIFISDKKISGFPGTLNVFSLSSSSAPIINLDFLCIPWFIASATIEQSYLPPVGILKLLCLSCLFHWPWKTPKGVVNEFSALRQLLTRLGPCHVLIAW